MCGDRSCLPSKKSAALSACAHRYCHSERVFWFDYYSWKEEVSRGESCDLLPGIACLFASAIEGIQFSWVTASDCNSISSFQPFLHIKVCIQAVCLCVFVCGMIANSC
jgi:hypothetical protein